MRRPACGLVLTFAVVGSGNSAHARPWCAFYDSSTYNCGFHSYAQCYTTIYGNGGWCRPNIFEPSGRDQRSGRTRPLPAIEGWRTKRVLWPLATALRALPLIEGAGAH